MFENKLSGQTGVISEVNERQWHGYSKSQGSVRFAEPKGETETQRHIKPHTAHTDTTQGLGRAGVL